MNKSVETMNEWIADILEKSDLFWNVKTEPIYLGDGTKTQFIATVREDNRHTFNTFKSYEVFQNWELAELAYRIGEQSGLELINGKQFDGGGVVALQLKNGDIKGIGANNDTVKNYITLINSHNGSTTLRFGYSNEVISCKNQFNKVFKQLSQSILHTANMKQRVDMAMLEFQNVNIEKQRMIDVFFRMAEMPMTDEQLRTAVQMTTGVDVTKTIGDAKDDYSTRAINNTKLLSDDITNEVNQKGATLWGLFNGITRYTTHTMGTDNSRDKSKMMGRNGKVDNNVLQYLENFVTN